MAIVLTEWLSGDRERFREGSAAERTEILQMYAENVQLHTEITRLNAELRQAQQIIHAQSERMRQRFAEMELMRDYIRSKFPSPGNEDHVRRVADAIDAAIKGRARIQEAGGPREVAELHNYNLCLLSAAEDVLRLLPELVERPALTPTVTATFANNGARVMATNE